MLVPEGERRLDGLDGLDGLVISLYAGGTTIRDTQHHLASTIGTDLSHKTIAKITDQVAEEVLTWQTRPLEALYPVIYLDAIIVEIRDGGHVRNKAAPVHPLPRVPTRAAARDLHHQFDRVAQLPVAEGDQEPRPLPPTTRRS